MEYFGRVVTVQIDSVLIDGDDLDIDFEVPFDDSSEQKEATIDIYNLSTNTSNKIKRGQYVQITAGYKDSNGVIFTGQTSSVQTKWAGVDKTTHITAIDSKPSGRQLVSKMYDNASASYILKDLADLGGYILGSNIKLGTDKRYDKYSADGKILEVMDRLCDDCGAKCYTTRGCLYIGPPGQTYGLQFNLSAKTGLIDTPEYFEEEEQDEEDTSLVRGYNVKALLTHQITVGSSVNITSKTANGTFKVKSGKHTSSGDTYYTEMRVEM